jgi:hypothetical protein
MSAEKDELITAGMDPSNAAALALSFEIKQMQTWFGSEPDAASWLNMWQGANQDLGAFYNRWNFAFPQMEF